MNSSVRDGLKTFGLPDEAEGIFYGTVAQVMADPRLNGQAHYMRRAFQKMKLDGILCISGKPTVYLKDYKKPVTRQEVNELQKKFWNQGTGTLLVIQDPDRVLIFSGMDAPSNDDAASVDTHAAFIEQIDRVANTLEKSRFVEQVASGYYYRNHHRHFNADNAVDQYLLDNLGVVSAKLCRNDSKVERKRVNALLGRIIFTCYLIDREIIFLQDYSFIRKKSVAKLVDLFRDYEPSRAKELLYKLFWQLRGDFNGSMFDDDLDTERESVTDDDIDTLKRFFRGDSLEIGQHMLGFWAYDFSIVPVETISAIYEKFLEREDSEDKEAKGAFYTPKHLAEMVVDEAVGSFNTLLGKKYLDPACGSGIFLAILFNRIASEWQRLYPQASMKTKVEELFHILEQCICGVDVNLTACRITCFSLYIAFLDQFEPPTLRELQEKTKKFLPKLLAYKKENHRNTETPAIFEGNFFDPRLPIADDFDVVLGNPPWVGRNQLADKQVEDWIFGKHNPYLKDAPKAKNKRKAIFLPQRQIAHAFMWKAPIYLNEGGRASFLLPSEALLNQTDRFQEAWFSRFQVDRILHLADYRKFLFFDAKRPCFIANFKRKKPEPSTHRLEYVVPKVRQQDPRSGLVSVFPEDRKWISLQDVLDQAKRSRAAVLWKSYLWGTVRDVRFIDYLSQLDTLNDIAGEPDSGKRWTRGKGFKPWYQIGFDERPDTYGKPKPIPGQLSDPFVKTIGDNLQMFVLQDDCISLKQRLESLRCKGKHPETPEENLNASLKGFHRSPDERLFQPPLVLVNKGFTKFSFVDFHVFYQDSLTGFVGRRNDDDKDLLRFFVIYLGSRLAKYFSFHTSGSWGTERDEVRVHELLRLPFSLPDSPHSSPHAAEIVKEVASRMKKLQREIEKFYAPEAHRPLNIEQTRKQKIEKLQADLEPLVYEYFDLSEEERILIEDTCDVYEPSSTPATPNSSIETLRETIRRDRLAYSSMLCGTLNNWSRIDQPKGKKQPFYFCAESARLKETGMVLVTIKKAKKKTDSRDIPADGQINKAVARLAKATSRQQGVFAYLRGIIWGDRDCIHLFKPDLFGQWTKTAALNDADAVFQAIIQSKKRWQ